MLKPSDRLDLYIASLTVGCSREAILTSQEASVLLKNPDFRKLYLGVKYR